MNILKRILIVIASLLRVLLIAALFVANEYVVQRGIVINKPKREVFDDVKFLKNQDNYNNRVMQYPGMKKDFKGTDGTVGFIYVWDSNNSNAGEGEEEIKVIKEGEQIDIEVRFINPFEGVLELSSIASQFYFWKVNLNCVNTYKYFIPLQQPLDIETINLSA